jgi:hypothetical protein
MKKPYDDRSDLEKLHSQWRKIQGIFERKREWSAAIVRAGTAMEIAANIAIRKRFEADSQFSSDFVNTLLVWANGIDGKFKKLIIPSEKVAKRRKALNALKATVERLNRERNTIVHKGAFSSAGEATEFVRLARKVAIKLVQPWEPTFTLEKGWARPSKKKKPSRE